MVIVAFTGFQHQRGCWYQGEIEMIWCCICMIEDWPIQLMKNTWCYASPMSKYWLPVDYHIHIWRCRCNSAAVTPVKYRSESNNPLGIFCKSKHGISGDTNERSFITTHPIPHPTSIPGYNNDENLRIPHSSELHRMRRSISDRWNFFFHGSPLQWRHIGF